MDQHWGTANPITIRDKEFGAVRLRGFGIYSYKISDPRVFHTKVSGTRDIYRVADLEGQLRDTILGRVAGTFAESNIPFLDMAANQVELAKKIAEQLKPTFADLGLSLESFVVENLSLPDELQKLLDQRIGMTMVGDMNRYTQFQVAQSMPIAAENPGGLAGAGVGLGAGLTMAQGMVNAIKPPAGGIRRTCRSRGTGRSHSRRRGNEILHGVWKNHSQDREILSGVRANAGVSHGWD